MTNATLLRRSIKGASFFAVLAGAILLLRSVDPTAEAYSRFVDDNIRAHGLNGIALYVVLVSALSCMAVPRQLLSFAGGYAFGALFGTVWATLGSLLGCMLAFAYSRFVGQSFVQRHLGKRIAKLEKFLGRAPFSMTFIIRCLPVGNNLLTNILAGVTRLPALPFFAGSLLGYIPQNFIFALLGSGVRVDAFWRTTISAALFILASAVGLFLYRKYRKDVEDGEESEGLESEKLEEKGKTHQTK